MDRMTLTCLLLVTAYSSVSADYLSDRQQAMAFVVDGRHEDALATWLQMAKPPASEVQQSDALHQAALCAVRLRQMDQALDFAGRIPLPSDSLACRLGILESARRWSDMVEEFESVEIASWPERLRGEAYVSRGMAHYALQHGREATRDFEAALKYLTDANSLGNCSNLLGDVCRHVLMDDERALAAYRQTYLIGTVYKQAQAAISAGEILSQRKEFDAALKGFDAIDLKDLTAPYWRGKLLCAHGRALAAIGKKAEAEAKFAEALALPELPATIRQECKELRK